MIDIHDTSIPFAKPESYQALLDRMTPEIHARLRTAVELGKWDSGERLSQTQLELCLQAIIAWEHVHLPETQRVAYIDRSGLQKSHCDD